MKFKALTTVLLFGLLAGCNGTKQDNTVQPTPEQQQVSKAKVTKPTATPIQQQKLKSTSNLEKPNLSTIAKAAKLTPAQVTQLLYKDKNNNKLLDFKIIVPTYIPAGFQVDEFEVKDVTYQGSMGKPEYTGHQYRIVYRNSSNYCFSFESVFGGLGSGPGEERTVEVSSPALGKVILGYTDFNQVSSKPSIAFQDDVIRGKQSYLFHSPEAFSQKCNTINLQEAVKIVESFQYLNP